MFRMRPGKPETAPQPHCMILSALLGHPYYTGHFVTAVFSYLSSFTGKNWLLIEFGGRPRGVSPKETQTRRGGLHTDCTNIAHQQGVTNAMSAVGATVPSPLGVSGARCVDENADQAQPSAAEAAAMPVGLRELSLGAQLEDSYERLGITQLWAWQAEALQLPEVLEGRRNLLYTADTSAGKTLVAELLVLRRLREGGARAKALFVVPFKAVVAQKAAYFEELLKGSGLVVTLA